MGRYLFNKYGAKRAEGSQGRSFHSKSERDFGEYLLWRERQGEISDIEYQVQVELSEAKILYKPDFRVFEKRLNEKVIYEVKGFETPEWRIKRKLYQAYGPSILRVFTMGKRGPTMKEEIIPKQPKLICCHCGQPALKGA